MPCGSTHADERSHVETTGSVSIGVEATGVESAGVESTGAETTGVESTGVESTGVESTGVESTGAETTGVESATRYALGPLCMDAPTHTPAGAAAQAVARG